MARAIRPAAKLWHRWFGLLAGLWLLLLAVTGSAIAFYDEIDTWLNPDWRTVAVQADAGYAALDQMIIEAGRAVPGFNPTMIELPSHAGDTLWMLGRAPIDDELRPVQIFINPYAGTVLGWRIQGAAELDRRHAMDIIYALHVDLMAGECVTALFGLVSLLWLIDHGVALVLAFPHGGRWPAALKISGRRRSLRRLFDLHRAPGLWLFPVTLVLALTGVTLAWPEDSRDAMRVVSPVSERLHEAFAPLPESGTSIGVEQAIARVTADRTEVHSVRLYPGLGVYAVRTFDARDPDDQGRLWTYVAMADGAISGVRHDTGESAGDLFFAWQYALHSGKAFGASGQALVLIGGLGTAALCVTGVMLWLRRGSRRRQV